MRLTFKPFDGRGLRHRKIIDEDTGKEVGHIRSGGVANGGGIEVNLFGNKYAITVNRYDQCWGFVKGVEAVLKHMTKTETVAYVVQSGSEAA